MKDYTLSELRKLNESYMQVVEAMARPNSYKNLAPQEAEELAKISPSYSSQQIWGNTSNWICSVANRMIKYRNMDFPTVYEHAKTIRKDLEDFEKHAKMLKMDIQSFATFEDFSKFMEEARRNGSMANGLSKDVMGNGRARQCYSLIKNGVANNEMSLVYEDDTWLIAYPFNLEYNRKFSAIGKWCHTGSFGDTDMYWSEYAVTPIYYILNKRGPICIMNNMEKCHVLCASYDHKEVRDQQDNIPVNFQQSKWDNYFTDLGLGKPMVEDIENVEDDYDVPEDAYGSGGDIYERIDENLISEMLFDDMNSSIESDNGDSGDIYLTKNIDYIDPNNENGFSARYAKDVDTSKYYTFEEFKDLVYREWHRNLSNSPVARFYDSEIARRIMSDKVFVELWNNAFDTYYNGADHFHIEDDKTMAERFSIEDMLKALDGEIDPNVLGYDMKRKIMDIKLFISGMIMNMSSAFRSKMRKMFTHEYGNIDMWDRTIQMSIDCDEGQHIAEQIRDGTFEIKFKGKPSLLSANLKGETSFACERTYTEEEWYDEMRNLVAAIKHYCKTPKDLEGQRYLELEDDKGNYYVR